MEGVSFPSLKRVSLSIFAYGSLGFGSLGVPSTLAHFPMVLSHPTMLFKTQQWSYRSSDMITSTKILHKFTRSTDLALQMELFLNPLDLSHVSIW